jgi:predicted GTPase
MIVYDMPGLNESVAKHDQHLATYARVLADVDVALWILEAPNRAMERVQSFLLTELRQINPTLTDRVVFALNKVDLVHPGETAWHPLVCLPSEEQLRNIEARIKDVQRLVREAVPTWKGTVIGYSATKRYNLPQLFAVMLDAVGKKRQWVLAEHKAIADYFEFVDERFLPSGRRGRRSESGNAGEPSRRELEDAVLSIPEDELRALLEQHRRRSGNRE